MHAYTVRDTRIYFAHYLSLINLQSQTFNDLQGHARRGDIAVASYLGHLGRPTTSRKACKKRTSPDNRHGCRPKNGRTASVSSERWD